MSEISVFGFCLLGAHGSFAGCMQSSLCFAAHAALSVHLMDAHISVAGGGADIVEEPRICSAFLNAKFLARSGTLLVAQATCGMSHNGSDTHVVPSVRTVRREG